MLLPGYRYLYNNNKKTICEICITYKPIMKQIVFLVLWISTIIMLFNIIIYYIFKLFLKNIISRVLEIKISNLVHILFVICLKISRIYSTFLHVYSIFCIKMLWKWFPSLPESKIVYCIMLFSFFHNLARYCIIFFMGSRIF